MSDISRLFFTCFQKNYMCDIADNVLELAFSQARELRAGVCVIGASGCCDKTLIARGRARTGLWCAKSHHTCIRGKCRHISLCTSVTGRCVGLDHGVAGHLYMCVDSGVVHKCDDQCQYGIMSNTGEPTCFISCRVLHEQVTRMSTTEYGHGDGAYKKFAVVPDTILSGTITRRLGTPRRSASANQCYNQVSKVVNELLFGQDKKTVIQKRRIGLQSDISKALKKYYKTCVALRMVPSALHKLNVFYAIRREGHCACVGGGPKYNSAICQAYTSLCTFWVLKCDSSDYGNSRSFPIVKNIVLAVLYMSRHGLVVKDKLLIKPDSLISTHLPSVADLRLQAVFRKGAALTEGRQYVINCITHQKDLSHFQ
jgi:hypothetical protein